MDCPENCWYFDLEPLGGLFLDLICSWLTGSWSDWVSGREWAVLGRGPLSSPWRNNNWSLINSDHDVDPFQPSTLQLSARTSSFRSFQTQLWTGQYLAYTRKFFSIQTFTIQTLLASNLWLQLCLVFMTRSLWSLSIVKLGFFDVLAPFKLSDLFNYKATISRTRSHVALVLV